MAQAMVDPFVLHGIISEECKNHNQLSIREQGIKTIARAAVDIVEKDFWHLFVIYFLNQTFQ